MSAIELNLSNLIQLFSTLSPILIGFFFIMLSIVNQSVKGLIYISGALIASVINLILMNVVRSPSNVSASAVCNLIELPFMTRYNSPSMSSMFIAFTLAYIILPMKINNQVNYGIIISLLLALGLDGLTKIQNGCTNMMGTILGMVVGLILGALWFSLFHITGNDDLLYFNELKSNSVVCKKPSKQTFKCSVYKNGQLVSSNIA